MQYSILQKWHIEKGNFDAIFNITEWHIDKENLMQSVTLQDENKKEKQLSILLNDT